jgi:hypothetical protein
MSQKTPFGILASQHCGPTLPLEVLKSAAGFYIGTSTQEGPYTRESAEYWNEKGAAQVALENGLWTQRKHL